MGWADTFRKMDQRRYRGAKVPDITASFWVTKILSTAMGEAVSDFLVFHFNPYFAVVCGGLGFLGALILQFMTDRYRPLAYWLLVAAISIFGTMLADMIHIVLGVPYWLSTGLFAASLLTILWGWNASERTLSIHSVTTPRREAFYWATVIATFALGTAAGDLTAATFGLGFLYSALLFTALFAIPVLAFFAFGLNEILAFWIAYILTRPMGASFADWFDKPLQAGGLGYGAPIVAIMLTAAVAIAVLYVWLRYRQQVARPVLAN